MRKTLLAAFKALIGVRTCLERSCEASEDYWSYAGEILIEQYKLDQAEDYLKHSLNTSHPLKPQMLPHVHVLLGQIYAQTDRPQEAIREFQMGLSSDSDGSVYYQLAWVYVRLGNKAAAQDAIAHEKELQNKRHDRAEVQMQDSDTAAGDIP